LVLAAVVVGSLVGFLITADDPQTPKPEQSTDQPTPQPWYRTQAPPPTMITAPDAPIFPDPMDEEPGQPVRPYEEALPTEVYVAPARRPAIDTLAIDTLARATLARATPPAPPTAKTRQQPPAPPQPSETAMVAPLPGTTKEGKPAWIKFARQTPSTDGRPRIALVIDDLGIDKKRTAQVIAFRVPLTLSFLTYATGLKRQTAAARKAGHELLLHFPMEPLGKGIDAGPNALIGGQDLEDVRRRLRWGFARFDAYVGVNNHMGSKFTGDAAGMAVVMEELNKRGLLFLDSRTTSKSIAGALALHMKVPMAERNIFLDNQNDYAAVKARLAETERLARRTGTAVAIGHPRDATIKALAEWLPQAAARGFALVPLTNIVRSSAAARPGG
jgi:polysaccharide deacetylase 2 family uncharacterized protein YibQ